MPEPAAPNAAAPEQADPARTPLIVRLLRAEALALAVVLGVAGAGMLVGAAAFGLSQQTFSLIDAVTTTTLATFGLLSLALSAILRLLRHLAGRPAGPLAPPPERSRSSS